MKTEEIKIKMKDCKKDKENYYRTIVSMTPEDKKFCIQNRLSVTKIVREAIKSLRKEELSK